MVSLWSESESRAELKREERGMFAWSSDELKRNDTIECEGLGFDTQVEVIQVEQGFIQSLDYASNPPDGDTFNGGGETGMHADFDFIFGENGVAVFFYSMMLKGREDL